MNTAEIPTGRLIYGCMGLGGAWDAPGYTDDDVARAAAAIDAALAIGVELFDHADIYSMGKAEAVFGEVLAARPGLREKIRLQSKCGIRLWENGLNNYYDLSHASIMERVEGILARLRTGHLDTLLFHRPDPLLDRREAARAVSELLADGRIGAVGVSNMSAAQMEYLQDSLTVPIVANQLEMSLAVRDWVDSGVTVNHRQGAGNPFPHGTLEHCMGRGIELQAYGSLANGRYTGAVPADELDDAGRATAALVRELGEEFGVAPESVLLGWLMRHPAAISPVIGTTSPARIAACGDAVSVAARMDRLQWYRLWITARGEFIP
ncbi:MULTISPECIES: aldo/keto reductase [Arthrobacter]|uniref:Aldo/keto reductase n=2 Tax=Arthrobacter TaxID=1663 RepID=A0ABU9KML5_9MICC|nr:aldo/keto reductase [Arthrobacter sp. YJM1]MDP5227935.1 aldo/keto reductase [Arthrobacter sp. YJM1]